MGAPLPSVSDDAAPWIVKLGGSILTRKRGPPRLRPKILGRLAREIVASARPAIVLHGAGSFGHPGAVRFALHRPPEPGQPGDARSRGAAIVAAEVRRLHAAVLRALLDAGGRPWSIPPGAALVQKAGRLETLDFTPYARALDRGLLPVSFGDVVPDSAWRFSIVSGDTLAVELVRASSSRHVLFVSDVPGIYDPADPDRRRIVPTVTAEVVQSLAPTGAGPDVTGGIRGKADAMVHIAELGADAGLISGLTDGALSRALRGEPVYGSWCQAHLR